MKRKLFVIPVILMIVSVFLAACSSNQNTTTTQSKPSTNKNTASNYFTLEAKETKIKYNNKLVETAMTYNGSVPGQEIRVKESQKVTIHFKNSLKEATTLHLHGLTDVNKMDGVPGVTQKPIKSGKSFDYTFTAPKPGTYWFHSHLNEATQIGNGLYGVLIVEPKNGEKVNVDKAVTINERSSMGSMDGMGNMDMSNKNMGGTDSSHTNASNHSDIMMSMYDTPIINGKAAPSIQPITVKKGDNVKLRFVNSGLFTQNIQIPAHEFKITGYDGESVNKPTLISNQLIQIAPGERYDVEFKANQPGNWGIKIYADNNTNLKAVIPITYKGYDNQKVKTEGTINKYFDFSTYGENSKTTVQSPTKEFQMILSSNDGGNTFTINSKKMPDPEVYSVNKGDVVRFTIKNETNVDHPMHLHGHHFQVLSRNGVPFTGSEVIKDTLNVKPNETYEIQFVADNPGTWLFHCHELHHAESGMVSLVKYN
ncbi:multicopper oxidase domain-containing protein [Bacillus sp. EB600]|uniref:multicopper oxidase domain-containing protein n=1 Tax=Bacillus sp. EB600 TaxID=2806345 RepID=UPI00210CB3EA|nr:multicopper oxidase domain-containing protein [Bacillus sp. EB600]MCQ6281534.1 multicopper oxidase domain-containing protein [Bacillus sp. EB600]